jgi:multicomponent Na+:H+ antiporter subunit B
MFAVVMLAGIYGLVSASFFVVMDAVDVAFTEASVGAGISTLLMLTTVAMTERTEREARHKPLLALIVVSITGVFLLYGTFDMPYFGSVDAPSHNHVGPRYTNNSMNEIGIPNMVTSVLASYRGFDTFGEVTVIFTAGIGVLALLGAVRRPEDRSATEAVNDSMHEQHLILRIIIKILIPFILLYAFYVQFHGDFGPGGGFQAGVIFAAGIILYSMLFGLNVALRVIKQPAVQLLSAVGVLIYGSVGVVSILNGGSFLEYSVLSADPISGQHLGILLIEFGVGLTVASVMIIIYFSFSGRSEDQQSKEGTSL